MPVALSGTATKVDDDGGTLDVEPGSRFPITATKGRVNLCGFSGPWSGDLADARDEAFGS